MTRVGGQAPAVARELEQLIERGAWQTLRTAVVHAVSAPQHAQAKTPMTGIGCDRSVRFFAGSVMALKDIWKRLSPEQRAERLLLAANAEILRESIPALYRIDVADGVKRAGMERGWFFTVSRALVTNAEISEPELLRLGATMFHEARHTEQLFRVARLVTTLGAAPAEVARKLGIPVAIVEQASKQPLSRGTREWEEARAWMRAFVNEGAQHQATTNRVQLEVAALAGARAQAQSALASGAGQAQARDVLDASIRATELEFTAYRAIPYEQDALVAEIRAANAIADAMYPGRTSAP